MVLQGNPDEEINHVLSIIFIHRSIRAFLSLSFFYTSFKLLIDTKRLYDPP